MEPEGSGVLYVAVGASHVEAARLAARSVRKTNPSLGIVLFTDQVETGPEFDEVVPVPDPKVRSKVDSFFRTPFAKTLYLDTDTRVQTDLGDMFRLLERFDLGIAHVTRAHKAKYRRQWKSDVPDVFPQHNSGVMLYRSTPEVFEFFRDWQKAYREAGRTSDQVTLRDLLWTSDIRLSVLPTRYNQRSYNPLARLFSDAPKPAILHLNQYNAGKRKFYHRLMDAITGP